MPTYRSDVVGSLLRPAYLVAARRDVEGGRLTPAEFKRLEDRAVDEAIDLQESAGLAVVTDGEMRRYAFFGHLIEALDGFDKLGGWAIPFRNEQGEQLIFKRPVVIERLRWRRSMCAEEFVYLRDRKSTRLNSSHDQISYAVFCLKKKKNNSITFTHHHQSRDLS